MLAVKNLLANARDKRDTGSIPESERSPWKRRGNPLQYSCLENPIETVRLQPMGSQRAGHNTRSTHSVFIKFFHDHIICYKFNRIQKLYQHLPNKHITKVDIWIANKHMKKCSKSLSSIQFSCSVMSDSAVHGLQHARPPCASPTPRIYPNYYTLSRWCHPTILSSVAPSPPALSLSQHQGLLIRVKWVNFSQEVAKVLEFQLQHQSFQWIPRTDLL